MRSEIRAGVRRLFRLPETTRRQARREADDELSAFLDARIEQLVARGLSLGEARAEAVRRLGGSVDTARANLRRSAEARYRRLSLRDRLGDIGYDVRHAVRGFFREPIFSTFAVLTLALGIGANAAMFGIVDKLLLRGPDQVTDPRRVVRLFWTMRESGIERTDASFELPAFANLRAATRTFVDVASYSPGERSFRSGNDARRIPATRVTANFFRVLGAQPEVGRFFTGDEETLTPPPVVVLGFGLWQSEFGGERTVIGTTVKFGATSYTIIGVAPKGFSGAEMDRVDAWFPMSMPKPDEARHWPTDAHANGWRIVGRLRPGITFDEAERDATAAHRRTYGGGQKTYAEARVSVGSFNFGREGKESPEASISRWLSGVSAVVLLMACANIINLLLTRAVRRRREMAVRLALGAGRARVVRTLLIESLVLACAGGVAGLGVASLIGGLVRHALLPNVDWSSGVIDTRVLMVSLLITIVTGVMIGLSPAWRASRTDLNSELKAGGREGSEHRSIVRAMLTLAQATLAMVLLVGAGLFVRSLENVRALDLGPQPDRVVWLSASWPSAPRELSHGERVEEARRQGQFYESALERFRALPSIERASLAIGVPLNGWFGVGLHVPGWDSLPQLAGGYPSISVVSSDYFATVGTRLIRGHAFTASDRAGSARVAIVNETMARTLWPADDGLGHCLEINDAPCSRVIGVVQDARRSSIHEDALMQYYVPFGQESGISGTTILVRPRGDPAAAYASLRRVLHDLDPTIGWVYGGVLQERVDPQVRPWRVGAMVFTLFGALALVVAAVGMFSVVAYLVEQRTHEIGVRMALGARGLDVVGLVVRGSTTMVVLGLTIGSGLALVGGRFLEPLLFNVRASDPPVILGSALVLVAVAIGASAIPALRARSVDPLVALRTD
jgi:predicted permease